MKKQDLIKAADDLNELLFDAEAMEDGWIYTDSTDDVMIDEIKSAALWLQAEDELEAGTIKLLQSLHWDDTDFTDLEDPEEQERYRTKEPKFSAGKGKKKSILWCDVD